MDNNIHHGRSLRQNGTSVLALGFRPFYLAAAIFALVALPVWVGAYTGVWVIGEELSPLAWHTHEMFFGFAPAVIAGFLLTAVRNWTGRPTPTGTLLAALLGLWIAGRVLMITGPMPVAAVVDLLFLPALGVAIAVPIWQSRNTRNFKVTAIVFVLACINALFHFSYLKALPSSILTAAPAFALDVIAILLTIISGRVIPAFTNNAVPGANARCERRIEVVAIGSLLLILVLDIAALRWQVVESIWIIVFGIAAVSHTIRLALWAPHRTVKNPLLLMLPAAYAWLPISFVLGIFVHLGVLPRAMPMHAFTIGAMSSMMLAMMARSALGHTGRPLSASWAEVGAFAALQLAALCRVFGVLLLPALYQNVVVASGILWTLAFGIFLIAYWPILTRPRIDGRAG